MSDFRYALRVLAKSPGFALTAILTLALAIGANTAIFSLVDAILIQPLPYPEPDRLAHVTRTYRGAGLSGEDIAHSGLVWEAVRDHATTLEAAVAGSASRVNLATGDRAVSVRQQRVGAGYFGVLGVSPARGREFTPEEDRANGPAAAILSARLWRSVFGANPDIVGRTVVLRGAAVTLVGVMPDGFRPASDDVDVWTPLRPSTTGEGEGQNYTIVARLRPGVTWPAAAAEMAAIIDPVLPRRTSASGAAISHGVSPLQNGVTAGMRRPLVLLWIAVLLVLLVASVNLAGVLLARAGQRTREIATRLALGGDRARVVRQLFAESLVIAAIGGGVGIVLGSGALETLKGAAADVFPAWQRVSLDARVLVAASGLTMLTAVLFGLVPALHASRLDVQAALAEGGTRAVAGGARGWPRRLLVVAEIAMGVVLLVGAGLLLRTFASLQGLSPGFDLTNVTTASASLDDARYRNVDRVQRLFDDTLSTLRVSHGVDAAAVALGLPYERILNLGVRVAGRDTKEQFACAAYVSDGFFAALRIPLRAGRGIQASDRRGSAPVVVVNDAFVRRFLPDRDPLGEQIVVGGSDARRIVGVVGDVRQLAGWGGYGPIDALPTVDLPVSQVSEDFLQIAHTWFSPSWIVRGRDEGAALAAEVRRAIEQADPLLPIAAVRQMDDIRASSVARQRLLMTLVGLLGAAAVMLAAIGVYGLIASLVTERTRELGIRLALGSTVAQAIRTAVLPAFSLTLAGLVAGVALAVGMSGLVRGLLWGVAPNDPLTFGAVAVVLLIAAGVASLVPALRVRRLDPAALLRE